MPELQYLAANQFDSGEDPITVPSAFAEIATVNVEGKRGHVVFEGLVSTADLTGLRIVQHSSPASSARTLVEDAGLNSPPDKVTLVLPGLDAHLTPAGGFFWIEVRIDGAAKLGVWAKSGGTAGLRVRGRAV